MRETIYRKLSNPKDIPRVNLVDFLRRGYRVAAIVHSHVTFCSYNNETIKL